MMLAQTLALAALLALTRTGDAYCNSMGSMGYGPRTSKAFPPGWNGLAKTPIQGWRSWYGVGMGGCRAPVPRRKAPRPGLPLSRLPR